jgi:hypothetical protein
MLEGFGGALMSSLYYPPYPINRCTPFLAIPLICEKGDRYKCVWKVNGKITTLGWCSVVQYFDIVTKSVSSYVIVSFSVRLYIATGP